MVEGAFGEMERLTSHSTSRRTVLRAGGIGLAAGLGLRSGRLLARSQESAATPVSGEDVAELAGLDAVMRGLVADWGLPGAQLAVGYEGRLVFDRGYGLADRERGESVLPEHRFRIASVSKTVTAVGIMRLVQAGTLSLDDAVFPLLDLAPPPGAVLDPRFDRVTVRHLLIHAGGWNSGAAGDPQYLPLSALAAATLGEAGPPSGEDIIRFMLGNGLEFDPGSMAVYSNFGFNVLGRVIEKVSGQGYAGFTQAEVFAPAGITGMELGKTRLADRAAGEVCYYAPPEYPPAVPSVFPGEGFVPFAYGSFFMDAMDSHGGWIARAADLARYAQAIDGSRGDALLDPATLAAMLTEPHVPFTSPNGAGNTDPATGLGWAVQDGPLGREWAHTGALGGSNGSILLRNDAGLTLAFVTNTLPADFFGFFAALRPALVDAAAAVSAWPDHDLTPTT